MQTAGISFKRVSEVTRALLGRQTHHQYGLPSAILEGLLRDGLHLARFEPLALPGVCQGLGRILCPKHQRQALLRAAAGHVEEPERPVNRRLLAFRNVLDIGVAKRGAKQAIVGKEIARSIFVVHHDHHMVELRSLDHLVRREMRLSAQVGLEPTKLNPRRLEEPCQPRVNLFSRASGCLGFGAGGGGFSSLNAATRRLSGSNKPT